MFKHTDAPHSEYTAQGHHYTKPKNSCLLNVRFLFVSEIRGFKIHIVIWCRYYLHIFIHVLYHVFIIHGMPHIVLCLYVGYPLLCYFFPPIRIISASFSSFIYCSVSLCLMLFIPISCWGFLNLLPKSLSYRLSMLLTISYRFWQFCIFIFKFLVVYLSLWSSCLGQCFSNLNVAHESPGDPVNYRSWFSRFCMGPGSLRFLASLWVILMLLGCGPTLNSKGLDHFFVHK